MIQLRILSGKQAGASWVARRFPVRIGRAGGADLRLEEMGVWDEHLRLDLVRGEGVRLRATPEALVRVNDQPLQEAILRNGDLVELGPVRLQFWLSETRQRALALREVLSWLIIGMVAAGQALLLYWLLS